jgi:outer membrane protein assembly factor BamD
MKRLIVVLIACFFLVSCGAKNVKKQGPGELYVDGVNLMKQEEYAKAVGKFAEVTENYPFDPLALVAAVKLGDAYFGKKDYVMAASTYENFVSAHPEDENAPYVLLRLGESYENLSLSIDRDQANTLKAIEKYTFLKNRYPRSNYSKQVDERMKRLEQKLADREMYVGEFYYRTNQYNAAIVRLEYYLKKYPNASGRDKAYFYISSSYKELASAEKADYYTEKLKAEFPKSIYARTTIRERKTLKLADSQPAEPSGIKRKRLKPAGEQEQAKAGEPVQIAKAEDAQKVPVDKPSRSGEQRPQKGDLETGDTASPSQAPGDSETTVASRSSGPGRSESQALEGDLIDQQPSGSDQVQPQIPTGTRLAKIDRTPAETGPSRKAGDIKLTPGMYQEEKKAVAPDQEKAGPGKGKETEKAKADDKGKKKDLDFFDKSKPIDIVSDTMEGFDKEKYVVFKGNVIAKQEDLYIFADSIEAHLNETSNEIDKAYAKQNVKIVKKERTATSREAVFDNKKGEIVLKGNVVVYQGQDRLSGDVVTYYVNEDRAVVEAATGKRARVILTPNK